MIIKQHPDFLEDVMPIHLNHYKLEYGYSIAHRTLDGVSNNHVYIKRDGSVLYCLERESAEFVRGKAMEPSWYTVLRHCFLRYMYPEDPHAFRLDLLRDDFKIPRVQLYTHAEVEALFKEAQLACAYPLSREHSCRVCGD